MAGASGTPPPTNLAEKGYLNMKKIWLGLSVACLLVGVFGTIEDVVSGTPFWDAATILFFFGLLAAFFGWLAWLWRIRSPLKRTAEQVGALADSARERGEAYRELSASLKRRVWKHRIIGTLMAVFGVALWPLTDWDTLGIAAGTVVLIFGIAYFMMGAPQDYAAMTDAATMLGFDRPRNIREFYEAFKDIQTPLGSGWLGRFISSPYDSLIFGPDLRGQYIYFYLEAGGEVGFIGYSFLEKFISQRLTEPTYPPVENLGADTAGHLCYHTDIFFFKDWLRDSIEQFGKTGKPLPFTASEPSEVYTFTENFKLTGQHFEVQDKDANTVYVVDGTVPLINLRIFDTQGDEVFKMTKEIGHALATYRFFYKGEPYGVLEKQLTFVRDKFSMDIQDGRLELTEYAGTIGHNFRVTLNGRLIGAIMDNMDITIENILWDNAFLIVHEKEYLPLITAMAVMVTRELARDEDGGLTNRTGGATDIL